MGRLLPPHLFWRRALRHLLCFHLLFPRLFPAAFRFPFFLALTLNVVFGLTLRGEGI